MQRVTVSLDDALARDLDELVRKKGYQNRSEAVRDMLRAAIGDARLAEGEAKHCVGVVSYVYNHHERDLAERLTALAHDHHDLVVSVIHAHLDHDHCIEAAIVQGPAARLRRYADELIAERGVRHGHANFVPVSRSAGRHRHIHPHGSGHDPNV